MNPVTKGLPAGSAAIDGPVASPASDARLHVRHHAALPGRWAKVGQEQVKAAIVKPLARKLWLAGYSAEEARERNAQQRRYVRSAAWCFVLALLAVVGAA